jgi:hypothetical protein
MLEVFFFFISMLLFLKQKMWLNNEKTYIYSSILLITDVRAKHLQWFVRILPVPERNSLHISLPRITRYRLVTPSKHMNSCGCVDFGNGAFCGYRQLWVHMCVYVCVCIILKTFNIFHSKKQHCFRKIFSVLNWGKLKYNSYSSEIIYHFMLLNHTISHETKPWYLKSSTHVSISFEHFKKS